MPLASLYSPPGAAANPSDALWGKAEGQVTRLSNVLDIAEHNHICGKCHVCVRRQKRK